MKFCSESYSYWHMIMSHGQVLQWTFKPKKSTKLPLDSKGYIHIYIESYSWIITMGLCHVSGKTSVLAVRCCCFVTNNNGTPHSHMRACGPSAITHGMLSHMRSGWSTHGLALSHATSYACHNHDIFIQFTIVILTTATLLRTINVNPGATK